MIEQRVTHEELYSCIYRIVNLANGKFYLGSTINYKHRINEHLSRLSHNNHHSPYLQNAWNYYGEDFFDFEIIEFCDIDQLHSREQFYLDLYKPYLAEIGYNVSRDSIAPTRGRKIHCSEETTKKRREQMLGNTITLGYHHTQEAKDAISKAHKGKKPANHIIQAGIIAHQKQWEDLISPTGELFSNIINLASFCRKHGINCGNLRAVYKGKRENCQGWKLANPIYVAKDRSDKGTKRGRSDNHAKCWIGKLISPEGTIYTDIINLRQFSMQHGLNITGLWRIYTGRLKQYKGWRFIHGD